MKHAYFDYAATTPVDKRVISVMKPYLGIKRGLFGNPSSIHVFGQKALSAMDIAREKLAKTISANANEITFTASASEANNLIIRGALKAYEQNVDLKNKIIPKVIISSIEHPSILETVKNLEKENKIKAFYAPVDENGIILLDTIKKELTEETILVSIMSVNNEMGAVQSIGDIVGVVEEFRSEHNSIYPLLHTDAVQAFIASDVDILKMRVDSLTLSAHKIYGPKGIGAIYISDKIRKANLVDGIITGGGQENDMRSGTQNVASIVGFSKAAEICVSERKKEKDRLKYMSLHLYMALRKNIEGVAINGDINLCSPHIINIFFPENDLANALDVGGIAVSAGSACSQRLIKPSYVLKAMGLDGDKIRRSIRISIGRFTTKKDIDLIAKKIIILCNGSKNVKYTDVWCDN